MQSSRELIDSINAEEDKRAAETYRFMEEQKIKKALAPAQWEDLKASLASHCANIKAASPVHLEMEEEGINEATVRNLRSGKSVFLRYDPDVPCIHVEQDWKSGHFGFRVAPDGMSVQAVEGKNPMRIGEIAIQILKRIR